MEPAEAARAVRFLSFVMVSRVGSQSGSMRRMRKSVVRLSDTAAAGTYLRAWSGAPARNFVVVSSRACVRRDEACFRLLCRRRAWSAPGAGGSAGTTCRRRRRRLWSSHCLVMTGPKVASIYLPVARRELAEQATLCSVFRVRWAG